MRITVEKNKNITFRVTGISKADRQELARKCIPGEPAILHKDTDNPFDRNAIGVYNKKGYQLGYIPRARNQEIQQILDNKEHTVIIKNVNTYMGTTGVVVEIKVKI